MEELTPDLSDSMLALAEAIGRLDTNAHDDVDVLLTPDELAEVLKIPARTIKDQLTAGKLPHHRFGKHYRFSSDDVKAILRMTARKPSSGPMRPRAIPAA